MLNIGTRGGHRRLLQLQACLLWEGNSLLLFSYSICRYLLFPQNTGNISLQLAGQCHRHRCQVNYNFFSRFVYFMLECSSKASALDIQTEEGGLRLPMQGRMNTTGDMMLMISLKKCCEHQVL